VQFKFALALAKQLDTQVGTPVKLGNCAELVKLAEPVELVVPVAVAFADNVLPLLLAVVDEGAVVEDDASCDNTIDAKS